MTSIIKVYLFLELNKWTDVIRVKFYDLKAPLPLSYLVLPTVQSSRHKTQNKTEERSSDVIKSSFFFRPQKLVGHSHTGESTHTDQSITPWLRLCWLDVYNNTTTHPTMKKSCVGFDIILKRERRERDGVVWNPVFRRSTVTLADYYCSYYSI